MNGHPSVYPPLLAAGGHWGTVCADGNAVNPAGPTPPCVAAAACEAPSVRSVVTNLCDCPAPNYGADGEAAPGHCHDEHALHAAAGAGGLDSFTHLITVHMAAVNATTSAGETPLHNAARNGHVSIVATLLALGAGVNAKENSGHTPLRIAAANRGNGISPFSRYLSVVSTLIAAGGHWGTACAGGNVVYPDGPSPSCAAAAECEAPSVRNAGTNRCDCPAPNVGRDGASAPGDCAAPSAEFCGGLTPPQSYSAEDSACVSFGCEEMTPPQFYSAEDSACVPLVECESPLVLYADVNDCHAEDALWDAVRTGDLDVVSHFIAVHMADVNVKDSAGLTPLHWAASSGHVSIVSALLAVGGGCECETTTARKRRNI